MAIDDRTLRDIAPTGRLRVALNYGNRVLVTPDADGTRAGIAVDLANLLADAVGLAVDFIDYQRAVDVSSSATLDEWDVCFLAVDPKRTETIAFTDPYVRIEGSYLASAACPAEGSAALQASGAPVGSVIGTAYSLTLQRLPGAEHVVMLRDIHAALAALDADDVQAVAGIRQVMLAESSTRPGSRILSPPFMEIRQAMAVPKGRPDAIAFLRAFLAEQARAGTVGDILQRHGVSRECAIVP